MNSSDTVCRVNSKVMKIERDDSIELMFEGTGAQCYDWITEHCTKYPNSKFYVESGIVMSFKIRQRFLQLGTIHDCVLSNGHYVCRNGELGKCGGDCEFNRKHSKEGVNVPLELLTPEAQRSVGV